MVLDEAGEALMEYRRNIYPDPNGSRAGQFLIYLLQNQYPPQCAHRVQLIKKADGQYLDFPADAELASFDAADKKWIAMALRYKQDTRKDAPIVNAADRDWRNFESELLACGIQLEFLCRDE